MKAMVMKKISNLKEETSPLEMVDLPKPVAAEDEIRIKVSACGVCHTELDEIEGRTPPPQLPVVLGHHVVGRVDQNGPGSDRFKLGDRVGVAWIFSACGECTLCRNDKENLCEKFRATGRDANGGYAQYMTVAEAFVYEIPQAFSDAQAAPLLCAGAIGYRSLRQTGLQDGQRLGLTGFGASAHLVIKMVRYRFRDVKVFVFARSEKERRFAEELGAQWSGDTAATAPQKLDCIIDTTPAWKPVVEALRNLKSGGRLVINAIRKESFDQKQLLDLDYAVHLWMEKEIKSVANITRQDVSQFLKLAADIPMQPEIEEFTLKEANRALVELKKSRIRGAKVLIIN